MARIDELVLKMRFDNARFKAAAQDTLGILDNLKTKLKFDGVKNAFKDSARGADELSRSVQNVDLSKIAGEVSGVNRAFSTMGIIGRTAIGKLTVDAMNFGRKITSSITQPLIQGGMNRAKNIEQARFQLQGLGADVVAIEAAAMKAVDGTAYGFDEAARAASQFYASNIRDAGEMEKALTAISGVAAMTSSEYSDIARIFTTVAGNGRVMASELNSFASRGLNVAATLAEARGISEEELRKQVSEGKVSFQEFYTAMNEAYGEHAKKAGETFSGALANAKAPLARIGADVAAVYLKSMTGLFNALRPFLNVVHGALEPIIELINAGQSAGIGALTRFFESLTEGLSKGGDRGWLGNIGQGIANLLVQFGRLKQAVGDAIFRQWGERFEGVRVVVDRLAAGFLRFTETVRFSDRFLRGVTEIFGALFSVVGLGASILKSLFGGLLVIGDAVGRHIVPPIVTLIGYIAQVVAWMVRWVDGTNVAEGAIGGLTFILVGAVKMIGKFLDFIVRLVDGISGLFNRVRKFALGGTIFDPDSYPEDQAAAFVNKIKALGTAIGRIPTKGIEFLAKAFRLLGTIIEEALVTIKAFAQSIDFSGISRIFDWIKNLKVFDNMSNPFEKLSNFKIDFSGATNSVREFGETVRGGIGGKGGVGDKIFQPIKSGLQSLIRYIGSVNWGGLMSRIGSAISSGASFIWDALKNLFQGVSDFIGRVDWNSVGRTVIEKIAQGLSAAGEFTANVASSIKDAISGAIERIDFGAIWDGIKDFGSRAREASVDFKEGVRDALKGDDLEIEVDVKASGDTNLDSILPKRAQVEASKSLLESFKEFFGGMFGGGGGYESLKATFGDGFGGFLESVAEGIAAFGQSLKNLGSFFTSPISSVFENINAAIRQGLSSVGLSLEDGAAGIARGFSNLADAFDVHQWVQTISTGVMALSMFRFTESFNGLVKSIKSIPDGVGSILSSVSAHIKTLSRAAMMAATGDFILKLAISIGILAASIWLLSGLSDEDLNQAAEGLLMIAVALGGMAFALSKMEFASGMGAAILGLALGLLGLAVAIKLLAAISWETMASGLIKLGLTLALFAGVMHAFPKHSVLKNAFALTMLAGSALMFYSAIRLFSTLNPEDFLGGLTAMVLVIGGIGLAMRAFPHEGKLMTIAGSILVLSFAVRMFASALKSISAIPFGDIVKSFLTIAAGLALLGVALWVMNKAAVTGGKMLVAQLLGIGAALLLMAIALRVLQGVSFEEIEGGLLALGTLLLVLAVSVRMMSKADLTKVTFTMMGFAVAIGVMTAALLILSQLDTQQVLGAAFALGIVVGAMAGLAAAVGHFKTGAASLLSMALVVGVVAGSLYALAQVDGESLASGVFAIAGALTALLVAAAIANIPQVAAGLSILGGAFLMLGGAVALAGAGLLAAGTGFGKFVDSMERLGPALESLNGAPLEALNEFSRNVDSGALVELGLAFGALREGIQGKTGWFGSGHQSLGDALMSLVEGLKAFNAEDVEGLVEKTTDSLEALGGLAPEITKTLEELRNGIGEVDGGWFGRDRQGLGPAVGDLAEGLQGFADIGAGDLAANAKAGLEALGEIGSKASKNLGKLRDGIGDTSKWYGSSHQSLGDSVRQLGDGLRAFAELGDDDVGGRAASAIRSLGGVEEEAIRTLPALAGALGGESYLWGAFESDGIGTGITALADGLRTFADLDQDSMIDRAINTLSKLGEIEGTNLEGIRDGLSSIDQLFNDKMSLGEGMASLSEGLEGFANLHEGGVIDNAQAALEALSSIEISPDQLKGLRDAMTEINSWWSSDKDSLGDSLGSLGDALTKFQDAPSGEKISSVFNSLSGVDFGGIKKLRDAFQTDSNFSSDNLGQSMQALGNGLRAFEDLGVSRNIRQVFDTLKNVDLSGLDRVKEAVGEGFGEDFGSGLADGVARVESAKGDLIAAINGMATEIEGKSEAFKSAGTKLMDGLKSGIHQKSGEVKAKANEVARNGAKGAEEAVPNFVSAGEALGEGLARGIRNKEGAVRAAARALAQAARSETEGMLDINSPSRVFRTIGQFVGIGLAQGIVGTQSQVEEASTLLAESTIDSAESTLEINSPSKRFDRIGGNVTEGLAQGIMRNQKDPLNSLAEMWRRIAQINKDGLDGTNAINEEVLRDFGLTIDQISPYHRIERLTNHANAQYATEVKQKRIKDEEEQERAEDERQKIYDDIEDTEQAVKDAREDLDEINAPTDADSLKEDTAATKKSAAESQKEAEQTARKKKDAERKLRDAEKAHSRAITKKDRYEYEQSGEEAGVAFKDGVAEGLIKEDDTPKYHEILADTLYDEFDRVREKASQFLGVLGAIRKMGNTFRDMGNQVNNLRRAFTRTANSKDIRSFTRNLWDSFEGATELTESMFSFLDVFEKFRPYVTMFLGLMTAMPQIMQGISGAANMLGGMVTSVGSIVGSLGGMMGPLGGMLGGLGPMVGGGIQAAIPAAIAGILAFVGAVIAAIVATYVIWDSGGEQMVLRLARSITDGIVKISRNLPELLQDFATQMIRGMANILVESPKMIADMIKGLMYGLIGFIRTAPSSIPKFIRALVDAFVYVITSYPAIFIDLGFAMIHAILEMFLNAIPELIMSLPQLFKDVGRAIVDGIVEGFSTAWDVFKETTMQHLYNLGNVFITFANYFRKFLGKELYPLLGMPEDAADDDILTDYERRLYNSTRDGYMNAFEDSNYHPTIRPEIDMDYVNEQFAQAELDSTVSLQAAQSAGASRAQADSAVEAASVTNLNYTQNITTPKPVSTIDIYRNTQRQLDNMIP